MTIESEIGKLEKEHTIVFSDKVRLILTKLIADRQKLEDKIRQIKDNKCGNCCPHDSKVFCSVCRECSDTVNQSKQLAEAKKEIERLEAEKTKAENKNVDAVVNGMVAKLEKQKPSLTAEDVLKKVKRIAKKLGKEDDEYGNISSMSFMDEIDKIEEALARPGKLMKTNECQIGIQTKKEGT